MPAAKNKTRKHPALAKGEVREGKSEIHSSSPLRRFFRNLPLWLIFILLVLLVLDDRLGIFDVLDLENPVAGETTKEGEFAYAGGIYNTESPLLDFFSPTVMYWEEAIYHWSQVYQLNPNIIAILIQIESCGNPYAESFADAQGLFQVIPYYHFQDKTNQLNPETNAQAGLFHMLDCLDRAAHHQEDQIGRAFACYNAGPSVIDAAQENWDPQAQYYYTWGTGIWAEVEAGKSESATVQQWQAADTFLCKDALYWQQKLDPIQDWKATINRFPNENTP